MDIEKLKVWLSAIRPFTLTASIIPVALGSVFAMKEGGKFNTFYFILSLSAMTLLQAAANLINDGDDFVNNIDTLESFSPTDVVVKNLLSAEEVSKLGMALLAFGTFIGLYLSYTKGILILVLEIIGALGVYFYTRKPFEFKYKGLGTPVIFFLFGPLPVIGAYFIQRQDFSYEAFYISMPIGLLTTAILHANDIRDIYHDKKAGIKTLSIAIGLKNAKKIYYLLLATSYMSIFVLSIYKIVPMWSFIVLVTIPAAIKNVQKLKSYDGNNLNINLLDAETAKLQSKFGVMFIISLLLENILR